MTDRERKELRRSMQPASVQPPDASLTSIIRGMLLATTFFLIVFAAWVFFALRNYGSGQYNYVFEHRFVVLDADNIIVDGSSFVFTLDGDDFEADWREEDMDREGRVSGVVLASPFRATRRTYGPESCLNGSIVFMWADNDSVAAEIPAGTCLAHGGETSLVLREPGTT